IEAKNKVSISEVIKGVIVQQILQTILGFIVVAAEEEQALPDDNAEILALGQTLETFTTKVALYNHPIEGFLFDSLGAALAFTLSGLSVKGAIVFFTFSTFKTVDDHSGYDIPFNPIQRIFGNNATYHDVHHQTFGLKKNFSQPFFTFWDRVLGTYLPHNEVPKHLAEKKFSSRGITDDDGSQVLKKSETTESKTASKRYNLRSRKNLS
ncbi:2319_t:CDS:2, partial [Racocetra fulgida]